MLLPTSSFHLPLDWFRRKMTEGFKKKRNQNSLSYDRKVFYSDKKFLLKHSKLEKFSWWSSCMGEKASEDMIIIMMMWVKREEKRETRRCFFDVFRADQHHLHHDRFCYFFSYEMIIIRMTGILPILSLKTHSDFLSYAVSAFSAKKCECTQ